MKYIHAITRRSTPTEIEPLSNDQQKGIILDYLQDKDGFKIEKDSKGKLRISENNPRFGDYFLSWKRDARGSANSKFRESATGIRLFRRGATTESERGLRFERGDMIIVARYDTLFGDHPRHVLETVYHYILGRDGRLVIADIGEITNDNLAGKIFKSIILTQANIRYEKTREINLKNKRVGKKGGKFLGGKKTPFGEIWEKIESGETSDLKDSIITEREMSKLDVPKIPFGKYLSAEGVLVPNKIERDALRYMKRLRKQNVSYRKIAVAVQKKFGVDERTGEPKIKISHSGIYKILNKN